MPDGVVQWFDAATGEAAVVRSGRVFRAAAREMATVTRRSGARVHFDIFRDEGVDRAVHVTLRPGPRGSHRQRRVGDLTGARRPATLGAGQFARPHPELGRSLASHPLEVVRAWASCLGARQLDIILALYAPDAVAHTDDGDVAGRAHLRSWLEASPLLHMAHTPAIRGQDGHVVLRWESTGVGQPGVEIRCRVEHGQIAEQWIAQAQPDGASVTVETAAGPAAMEIVTHGDVDDAARAVARKHLAAVIERIGEPVLFARVKLTEAPDPAQERPSTAQVSVDVNGDVVRAKVSAPTMREAIDLLQGRLRDKLEHRTQHRLGSRRRPPPPAAGGRRRGEPLVARESDEREVVRHKSYAVDELSPDEAAFDLEQLDFDFHLFCDLATGEDAVLERRGDGSYLLTRLHAQVTDPQRTAIVLTVADHGAPELTVGEAVERLDADGEPFVFFANAGTGRGNVLYRRDDGHYGLLAPAE